MKELIVLVVIFTIIGSYPVNSKELASSSVSYLEFSPQSTMRTDLMLALQQTDNTTSGQSPLSSHPDYILPKKVLFFSALIPGAGEFYCKSYIRSLAFFGVEVGAWVIYGMYRQKGKDKEQEFQAYADDPVSGWSVEQYEAWFNNLNPDDRKTFSHNLPKNNNDNVVKTQQYYEMIGKYDQFLPGWLPLPDDIILTLSENDANSIYNYVLSEREHYMDMRYDSNQLFKMSTNGAYIAMFNHILSAIDAAWVAKKHNRELVTSSLRFENKYFNDDYQTFLSLNVKW